MSKDRTVLITTQASRTQPLKHSRQSMQRYLRYLKNDTTDVARQEQLNFVRTLQAWRGA